MLPQKKAESSKKPDKGHSKNPTVGNEAESSIVTFGVTSFGNDIVSCNKK